MKIVYTPIITTFLFTNISKWAAIHKSTQFVMIKHKHRKRKSKFTTQFLKLRNGIY
jgi:hypothetical protein